MNSVASALLVAAIWLAVLLGPQLSPWTWGASLLALGCALLAALPACWRRRAVPVGSGSMVLGAVVTGWFVWRALASPVLDLAVADLLLLAAVVGAFVVVRAIQGDRAAERVFLWGLALLVLASAAVVARQVGDPAFTPGFVRRHGLPSGFFGHYNYGANFLIGSSCLIAGAALFGAYGKLERSVFGGIALIGMVAVFFTTSRGGQIGAASGMALFAAMALVMGRRQESRWFAPGIVALPLIGIGLVVFLIKGWSNAQEVRNQTGGIDGMLDNSIRLNLIGISASCIGLHPWEGGGSRSFSWECFQFWEVASHGAGANLPEQVHNEMLQAATDYGAVGAVLLGLLIGTIAVGAVIRALFDDVPGKASEADSWRIGGLAGLAGILVQSNFSFVFHLVPGALLLGICLGRAAHPGDGAKAGPARRVGSAVYLSAMALACAGWLLPMGWKGVRVAQVRWADTYGGPVEIAPETRIAALTEAIRIWPAGEFFKQRAELRQGLILLGIAGVVDEKMLEMAIGDYREAASRNGFDPGPVVNLANLLSVAGNDDAAEEEFAKASRLQGGMEGGFKSEFSKADYLCRKSGRLLAAGNEGDALQTLARARKILVDAFTFPSGAPLGQEARTLRIEVAERLGVMLSRAGRDQEAEQEFKDAALVYGGIGIRYFHAQHLLLKGKRIWNERKPGEALGLFLEAHNLLGRTGGFLPTGVTPDDHAKLRKSLDEHIRFLKQAKVEPVALPGS